MRDLEDPRLIELRSRLDRAFEELADELNDYGRLNEEIEAAKFRFARRFRDWAARGGWII